MSSKLGAFASRGQAKDYDDMMFLILHSHEEIHRIRAQLDLEHRQAFVNSYTRNNSGAAGASKVMRMKFLFGVA
jgi:hypothetical protein